MNLNIRATIINWVSPSKGEEVNIMMESFDQAEQLVQRAVEVLELNVDEKVPARVVDLENNQMRIVVHR